ncbi:hypothetical protein C8R44DRAFT_885550 [Mycena epipterygia]|nr:hypothetical protein C8R44DRAFT_885550 [Mycena epipterygia]
MVTVAAAGRAAEDEEDEEDARLDDGAVEILDEDEYAWGEAWAAFNSSLAILCINSCPCSLSLPAVSLSPFGSCASTPLPFCFARSVSPRRVIAALHSPSFHCRALAFRPRVLRVSYCSVLTSRYSARACPFSFSFLFPMPGPSLRCAPDRPSPPPRRAFAVLRDPSSLHSPSFPSRRLSSPFIPSTSPPIYFSSQSPSTIPSRSHFALSCTSRLPPSPASPCRAFADPPFLFFLIFPVRLCPYCAFFCRPPSYLRPPVAMLRIARSFLSHALPEAHGCASAGKRAVARATTTASRSMLRARASPRVTSSHVPAPTPPTSIISLPRVPFVSASFTPRPHLSAPPLHPSVLPRSSLALLFVQPRSCSVFPSSRYNLRAMIPHISSPPARASMGLSPPSLVVFTLHPSLCSSPILASPASVAAHSVSSTHAFLPMDAVF